MRVRVSRVVLVGLSGSGKSTTGRILADRLGWDLVDTDRTVAEDAGLDIPAIFRTHGEAEFRRREAAAVSAALSRERVVVVPGAGWAGQPESFGRLPAQTAVVWLQVEPGIAAGRLEGSPEQRPLLTHGDMATRLEELHAERAPSYARAGIAVDTKGRTPEDVADIVIARLASHYGIDGRAD